MFIESKCGCITSPVIGKVRYCGTHVARSGGVAVNSGKKIEYPAHGMTVEGWNGGK